MTKIDVISGFLGAGKTTLIKKLLQEALAGSRTVLIENEFGEIGIDGGFLQESGIEIREMNSGCICCSLVGDFGTSLREVIETYQPERVLIEPSGVGKLSDVLKAVENVAKDMALEVSSAVTVADATKCKMYMKNFGEFFNDQIACAGTILLTRLDKVDQEKVKDCVERIREKNASATIITTPLCELSGAEILKAMEGEGRLDHMMQELLEETIEHHHHDEHCGCHGHEGHEHHHHDEHCGCQGHEGHEHHHHDEHCGCHGHEGHEHHHHDEHCGCHGHHEHGHHHHDHHADEIFASWGMETHNNYSEERIAEILRLLDEGSCGMILRAKGMVPDADGNWHYFDFVPGEQEVRKGQPQVTGRICVIGSGLQEDKLKELFEG